MKNLLAKIWVPLMLVSLAAMQSFGIDAGRSASLRMLADSLILTQLTDTTNITDSILPADIPSAKDTIKIPDSLRFTDPFKYRYYIALKDSTTRFQVRDSLIMAGDT